jgi:hypothetical protein
MLITRIRPNVTHRTEAQPVEKVAHDAREQLLATDRGDRGVRRGAHRIVTLLELALGVALEQRGELRFEADVAARTHRVDGRDAQLDVRTVEISLREALREQRAHLGILLLGYSHAHRRQELLVGTARERFGRSHARRNVRRPQLHRRERRRQYATQHIVDRRRFQRRRVRADGFARGSVDQLAVVELDQRDARRRDAQLAIAKRDQRIQGRRLGPSDQSFDGRGTERTIRCGKLRDQCRQVAARGDR